MRIVRHLAEGTARLALRQGDVLVDLETEHRDLPPLLSELDADSSDETPMSEILGRAAELATGTHFEFDSAALLSPVGMPPAILAVGLNYAAHAAEGGREPPQVPVIFNKHHNCITNPKAPIHIPADAAKMVDYEGELAFVIGRKCRHVPTERAQEVIAGYTIMNDVSVRDWQRASPTMTMGKSWDTHGPCGPLLVSGAEIDPHSLSLRTQVNDELRQDSNTSDLIFNCFALVEHLTKAMTLSAGTIISTGTPAGVGVYFDPPKMLAAGDQVTITIESIGTLTNPVIAEPTD